MSNNETTIEAEIQAKGLNAPRLTPEAIDDLIVCKYYNQASQMFPDAPEHNSLKCLTICVLVLKNGFTVVGKSACASPENYDREIGIKIAYANAREQIWALAGYELRSRLAAA